MVEITKTIKTPKKIFIKGKIISTSANPEDNKIIKHLINIGVARKLHPQISLSCIKPFKCELIEDQTCIFVESNMKNACLGPYKIVQDEVISYIALK